MLKWLAKIFGEKGDTGIRDGIRSELRWTPERVEAMINEAGRRDVLLLAGQLGWTAANPPPLWVWPQIVSEARIRRLKRETLEATEIGMEQYRRHVESLDKPTRH